MSKIKKILIPSLTFIFVFLMLIIPALSFAAGSATPDTGLVPCDNVTTKCDFTQLMNLVNKVIHFILYDMVIPIAAIMFAYAGFELITAGGEAAHARTKAKNIFTNALLGLVIAIGAFLIIRTILSILGYQGSWIGFNPL